MDRPLEHDDRHALGDDLPFALLLLLNGIGMGLFANRAGVMNSLPPRRRGAGAGMNATFQNSAMVLSIGIFFSLLIVGLSSGLPAALQHGLTAHSVPRPLAARIAHLPPVASLFAALLGYDPVQRYWVRPGSCTTSPPTRPRS